MKSAYLIALAVVLVGCNPGTSTEPPANPDKTKIPETSKPRESTSTEGSKPETTADNTKPTESNNAETIEIDPNVKATDVPATYKTPAFYYYGLNLEKSPVFELQGGPTGYKSGGYDMKLIKLNSDSAIYRQTWTGGLSDLGTSDYLVNAEGIFAISVNGKKIDPPQIELKANPAAGQTWTSNSKLELPNASISSSTMKVDGMKDIKLGKATVNTLAVSAKVEGKQAGSAINMTMVEYFVKNKGPVKITMSNKMGSGPAKEVILQAK